MTTPDWIICVIVMLFVIVGQARGDELKLPNLEKDNRYLTDIIHELVSASELSAAEATTQTAREERLP